MKTLVIGASTNSDRYSFKAITKLMSFDHEVVAIANKPGEVANVTFDTTFINYTDVDTVTLYVNPSRQREYYQYIISLKPRRVIFNPGTENKEFYNILKTSGIYFEEACTLVLLATKQY